MAKRKSGLVSALPGMRPTLILDRITGEVLTQEHLDWNLTSLVTAVTTAANEYYQEHKELVKGELKGYTGRPQPAEYARGKGWTLLDGLPRDVKVKSRVERLARFNLVQTVSSYVLNPNPLKQEPRFNATVNLGAVDSAMASLELQGNQLILSFKCWSGDYLLYFTVPPYIFQRNVIKYSLPTIRNVKGEWVFGYSIQEATEARGPGIYKAGVDLGRVEPFTLAVLNEQDKRIAHYTSSGRLKQVNLKRERLLVEKQYLTAKIGAYQTLGLDSTGLKQEQDYKRSKITRLGVEVAKQLGAEVTQKLTKHKVSILNVEDLRWAAGVRYGSRWNHAKQQEHLQHALARKGVSVKKVNPRNTSKDCHNCGNELDYNSKTRTVWCNECKNKLDRDYNAAINIARDKNKNSKFVSPPASGGVGVTVALSEQVTVQLEPNSVLSEEKQLNYTTLPSHMVNSWRTTDLAVWFAGSTPARSTKISKETL